MKISFFTVLFLAPVLILSGCTTSSPAQGEGNSRADSLQDEKRIIPIHNPLPDGTAELLDGFEDENFWYALGASKKDDYSIDTDVSSEWSASGENCGIWTFANIPEGAAATFVCESPPSKNWSDAAMLIADINNTSREPLFMRAEIQSGPFHAVSRTEPVQIGIGENTNVIFGLVYGLTDENGNSVPFLPDADDVRAVSFLIQGKARAGTVQTDSISIVRKDLK